MFVDKAKITIKSGNGGNGKISFAGSKCLKGGPDGGDGGDGGDIIFRSVGKNESLINFKTKRYYEAENGHNGEENNKHGRNGKNLIIEVPVGTQIWTINEEHLIYDFVREETKVISRGGKGGGGNNRFKSSTNVAPRIREEGKKGYRLDIILIMKIIADFGIIGKPNSGKSTFLSKISRANPKIGDYPFSTIYPNIGTIKVNTKYYTFADIPGLIEDAHKGKGLGHDFLKHIERCKILIHMVDGSKNNIENDLYEVRKELDLYGIKEKIEIIVINKVDILDTIERNNKYYYISSLTCEGIEELLKYLMTLL